MYCVVRHDPGFLSAVVRIRVNSGHPRFCLGPRKVWPPSTSIHHHSVIVNLTRAKQVKCIYLLLIVIVIILAASHNSPLRCLKLLFMSNELKRDEMFTCMNNC